MNKVPGVLLRAVLLLTAVLTPPMLPSGMPARPDLVVIVVAVAALMHGPGTGALVGLAGGWLIDLTPPGGDPLGAAALTYLLAGLVAGWTRRWATWSPLLPFAATAATALLVQAIRGITAAAGFGTAPLLELAWTLALTLLFAVVLVPVLLTLERGLAERGWV